MERYEAKEAKLSMFTLTNDPFDQIVGRRTSIVPDSAVGVGRRRSSAVAPEQLTHQTYKEVPRLEPIESRREEDQPAPEPAQLEQA